MAPLPNSSLCLESRFSVTYDRNVGISAPPAGIAPNGKPMSGPRSHGFQVRRRSARDSHGRPTGIGSPAVRRRCAATHRASPTANSADRDDDDVDAVGELQRAERQPLLAGHLVQADQADGQTDEQRREPADPGGAEHRGDRDERQHHDREVVGRADVDGERGHDRRQQHQQDRADDAADEVPDGGGGQRLRAASLAWPSGCPRSPPPPPRSHPVCSAGSRWSSRRTCRRSRCPANMMNAPVGSSAVGDRQQQRHRHGRADARQHADRGAQQHADRGEQQV